MKKLLIALFFIYALFFSTAQAQTEQGNYLLGGSVSASAYTPTHDHTYYLVYIAPNIGYFIANDIAIGARVPLSYNTSYQNSSNITSVFSFGITPSVRYYFAKSEKNSLFTSISFGINSIYNSNSKNFSSSLLGDANVGFVYFLNRNIGLESSIEYYFYKPLILNSYMSSSIRLALGFQVYFGKDK